ncbi:MAG TPA: LysR substrate-binding domain-containing protein [Labilithrix sp.]|nr:LysR substrate-binding domain-containing protein [Labilithrix sp.]
MQRTGSHGGAGRALEVDPTTVGRRIGALEREAGVRLFVRTPSGLELTSAGKMLVPRAERIELEVLASERELRGSGAEVGGPLRLTAGDGLVQYVLVPGLAELRRQHGGVEIELRADTRTLDLSRREADVAVRLSRPTQPALVARKLGSMRFALYGSRAYLDRRGTPRGLRDLGSHDWIGFDETLDALPQNRWLRRAVRAPHWVVRANTTAAQVVACAEGHGLALLPTFVAPHEPRLVPVLPRVVGPSREAWAVFHSDMRNDRRVAAVVAWLARVVDLA